MAAAKTRKRKAKRAKAPSRPHRDASESDDSDESAEEEDDLSDEALEREGAIETTAEVVDDGALGAVVAKKAKKSETAISRVDPMQIYMREVQRHPLLTPQEEHELAVRYTETQDVEAAARMVTANLRLVVKIAYEYRRAYRNMMDLIQEGNIGLMQAVKRYDPYRGVKLSSYSAWWIRAYILRFILNNWRMVKIGTTQAQRKLFFNLNKEKAKLTAMGIEPSHAEIAKRLNVEEKEVIEMDRRLSRGDASLDAPVGESDGRQTSRVELLPSTSRGPGEIAESMELQDIVRQKLDEFRTTLSGKDLSIFDKRLVAEDPLTLQQLGDEFGVSRERVRQLEARITGKLRTFLRETLGDAVGVGGQ